MKRKVESSLSIKNTKNFALARTLVIFSLVFASRYIQLRPSFNIPSGKLDRRNESFRPVAVQTWQKSGSCPIGTVPIRRIQRQDLLTAASLEQFGRKFPEISYAANKTDAKHSKFVSLNSKTVNLDRLVNRSVSS